KTNAVARSGDDVVTPNHHGMIQQRRGGDAQWRQFGDLRHGQAIEQAKRRRAVQGKLVKLPDAVGELDLFVKTVFFQSGMNALDEAGLQFQEGAVAEFQDVDIGADASFVVEKKRVNAGAGGQA